jgi:hypothetical protein
MVENRAEGGPQQAPDTRSPEARVIESEENRNQMKMVKYT